MMELRMYEADRDYETVKGWWEAHGLPAMPREGLPLLGCLAVADGVPVAAQWLYMDNSCPVCFMTWPVGNPDARGRDVFRGLELITEFLQREARELDYSLMVAVTERASVGKVWERAGLGKTSTVSEYMMGLDEGKN